MDHCRKALELEPVNTRIYEEKGLLHEAMGESVQAVDAWKMATEIDSRDWRGHYRLGMGLAKAGKNEQAADSLKKAIIAGQFSKDRVFREKVNQIKSLMNRLSAGSGSRTVKSTPADSENPKIKPADPVKAAACVKKAKKFAAEKRPKRAEREYSACVSLDPENADARIGLADLYMGDGRITKAKKEFIAALELIPGGDKKAGYCSFRLGIIYGRLGEHKSAAESYIRTFAADGTDADAASGAALSLEKLRQCAQAMEYFKKSLELKPGGKEASAGLNRCEIETIGQEAVLAELKMRQAIDPAAAAVTEDEKKLFVWMRNADYEGGVDLLRANGYPLAGYVAERRDDTGRVRLMLTIEGYRVYVKIQAKQAIKLFQKKGVNTKYAFMLRDMGGKPLFYSDGTLTPEGNDVYREALSGNKKWIMPWDPVPAPENGPEAKEIKDLLASGYIEIAEPEYLWLLRATDCPEEILAKDCGIKKINPQLKTRYFMPYGEPSELLRVKLGLTINLDSYIFKYRNGDQEIPEGMSSNFFGTGGVERHKYCENGKIWGAKISGN